MIRIFLWFKFHWTGAVFCILTPCDSKRFRSFKGICRLHFRPWRCRRYIPMKLSPNCTALKLRGLYFLLLSPWERQIQHDIYREQHKHGINAQKHPCLEWDSNPRPQCSSGRRYSCLGPRVHSDRHEFLIRKSVYIYIYILVWKVDFFIYCFGSVKSISP
jgi:hypothetical protein